MIIIPLYILVIILIGTFRKIDCFDTFMEGSKKGLHTVYLLFPTIIGIVFAVNVFVESGIIEILKIFIRNPVIVPELLIQAFLRPISANSALIMMNNIYHVYSPNSLTGQISSLIQGCSDTTIYVITIYFGSVKISETSYTLWVGLLTDLITFILAIILGNLFL